jgi:hypothetical protein
MRYPGGLIANSPITAAYPSGVWTHAQTQPYAAQNVWMRDQFWPNTTLLLQGNGTNGAQNNTFLDSSTNNFTITRNGNTTQGSFTPYEANGYWSNYFDGNGDFLSIADNAAFTLGSGDWTIEAWVFTGASATQKVVAGQIDSGGTTLSLSFQLDMSSTDYPRVIIASGTTLYIATSSSTLPKNQWVHLAGVRDGNTMRIYVNGVQTGTQGVTGVTVNDSSSNVGIGRHGQYAGLDWDGYISNLRLVKGTCVYPSGTTFIPSAAPLTAITNTSLLTCQSNRFIDNSTNAFALTVNGTPSVQAFQPFPGATTWSGSVLGGSGYFDGTGDYLSDIGTTSSFNFMHNSSALWTWECWAYIPSPSTDQYFIDNTNGTSNQIGLYLGIESSKLIFSITRGGSGTLVASGLSTDNVPANQWVHLAITYDQSLGSSNGKFYINGVASGTANKTANAPSSSNASNAMRVACFGSGAGGFITGYISNMRISNSVVYASAFTPPTSPVTGGALLLNFTNAGIFDSAMMNNLETVGNAQVSTSVVKYGTGSMAFDGSGDRLVGVNTPNLNFGSGAWTVEFWIYATDQVIGPLVNQCSQASSAGWGIWAYNGGGGTNRRLTVFLNGASFSLVTGADAWPSNTWTHIAVVKSGTNLTVYSNGVNVASSTSAPATLTDTTAPPMVGATVSGVNWGSSYAFAGYLDDLRITKGAARYIGNFTPPVARMPQQ